MRAIIVIFPLLTLLVSALPLRAEEDTVAAKLIPFDALTETNRALVRGVTDHYTLRRQYSNRQIKARPPEFEWLMDHMDGCSVLAQKLGLLTYRATRDEQGRFQADNREGASGFVQPALARDGKRVYYVAGSQHGVFQARGRGVVVMDYAQPQPGTIQYSSTVFVKVDNTGLAMLAQLFSIFIRNAVDQNFEHVMRQPICLSEKAVAEPQKLLEQIGLMPEEDRKLVEPFAVMLRHP